MGKKTITINQGKSLMMKIKETLNGKPQPTPSDKSYSLESTVQ